MSWNILFPLLSWIWDMEVSHLYLQATRQAPGKLHSNELRRSLGLKMTPEQNHLSSLVWLSAGMLCETEISLSLKLLFIWCLYSLTVVCNVIHIPSKPSPASFFFILDSSHTPSSSTQHILLGLASKLIPNFTILYLLPLSKLPWCVTWIMVFVS